MNFHRASLTLYALLVAAAISGMIFLKNREADILQRQDVGLLLEELSRRDIAVGQDVLKLRASLLFHFDTLAAASRRIDAMMADLEIKFHRVDSLGSPGIDRLFTAYRKAMEEKLILLERIKRRHAITSNSLHYLPGAVDRFQAENAGRLRRLSGRLLKELLRFHNLPDQERKARVDAAVKRLEAMQPPAQPIPALKNILSHVDLFMGERETLEGEIKAFFSNPAPKRLEALQFSYHGLRRQETGRLNLFVQVLFVITILLLAGVGVSLMALQGANRRMQVEAARKQLTEKDLRSSEEKFRSVTMSANDAIISTDVEGMVISWNRAAHDMFGYGDEEILGESVSLLIPDEFQQAHVAGIDRLKRTGKGRITGKTVELRAKRRSGEEFPVELSLSTWFSGGKRSFSAVIRDITERKKTEEALHAAKEASELANRAKTSFLAHMSHEIRTPMSTIIGMGELLNASELNADQRQCVEVLNRAGTGLLALINDVLDLSKVEAEQLALEESPFDLYDLLEDCISILKVQAEDKALELSHEVLEEVPRFVVGDAQRLRQILLNLLGNALKFTERGRVRLEAAARGGNRLLFTVSDTGVGISADKRLVIFDPFIQEDASTTRQYGGTGLGLAICHRLVRQMEGRIWVESRPGEGSIFFFTARLPAAAPPAEVAPRPAARNAEAGKKLEEMAVLLVDDAEDNLLIFTAFLKKSVRRLETAKNGAQAVEKFQAGGFDVILMDMQMPVMDGYTATSTIRQLERESGAPPIRIIALSAHAFKEDMRNAMEAGCDMHLSKPIRKGKLLEELAAPLRPPADA